MTALFRNDAQGVYPPSYYAATADIPPPRAPLDGDARFDVAIIGAGFCGLWAALIPTVIDQNPCAHLRMPRDMIFHGWSMRLFQAWQHSATMSS